MPTTGTLTLATKSMTLHLLPGATLVMGGGLAWVLWKQRQRIQQNEATQTDLSQQLNGVKADLNALKRDQQRQKEQERQREQDTLVQNKPKTDKDASRYGLFKQLLNENLSFRKSQ